MPVFQDLANPKKRALKRKDGTIPPPLPPAPEPVAPATLRVRILRSIHGSRRGTFLQGQVVHLPADVAREWIKLGLVEQDKMIDSAPETKG